MNNDSRDLKLDDFSIKIIEYDQFTKQYRLNITGSFTESKLEKLLQLLRDFMEAQKHD